VRPKTIVTMPGRRSATKDPALTTAASLARWYGSDLHVVQVGPSQAVGEESLAGVNVATAVLPGNPVRAIADYSDRVLADLVVVGKRPRGAGGYWSPGSFAAAVGKAVKSPTIAVPNRDTQGTDSASGFRNILVPIDFSEASLAALSDALVLAQQSGGRLRLLHVLEGFPRETVYSGARAFRLMHDFRARVARVNRQLESLIPSDALNWAEIDVATVSGLAHNAIVTAASDLRADLVVLGLPRRSGMEEFVTGSTVRRVLRRTTAPVLLVPGPAAASVASLAHQGDVQSAADPGVLARAAAAGSVTLSPEL
jgi:nucleotide-binding universal stress UspA family protein